MEVQDNSDRDELTDEQIVQRIVARPGEKYPIRLFHLINGMLLIGFVIEVFPEVTMVLRPYVIEAMYDPKKDNIDEYEFTPYLNQLADFDPQELVPVSFMNNSMVAIVIPAQHVIDNYTGMIRIKETLASSEEDFQLYTRSWPNPNTKH